MSYMIKEIFLTLQGEGMQAGRRAVFVRFAGCNLWSGREVDRTRAVCKFCDTDFVGTDGVNGGKFVSAHAVADRAAAIWGDGTAERYVVLTGGEPMLQVDAALVDALHARGFEIAMESNGTIAAAPGLDWICVSPKAGSIVVQQSGNELKLVWPQVGIDIVLLESWAFKHRLIQPMDCADSPASTAAAIAFVMAHPCWRLTTQTHKALGLA